MLVEKIGLSSREFLVLKNLIFGVKDVIRFKQSIAMVLSTAPLKN